MGVKQHVPSLLPSCRARLLFIGLTSSGHLLTRVSALARPNTARNRDQCGLLTAAFPVPRALPGAENVCKKYVSNE